MRFVVLLRGINVGGKNKVPMAALNQVLSERYADVRTYIQSGNVVLDSGDSGDSAADVAAWIEQTLPTRFSLDSALVRVLVLDRRAYRQVIDQAPAGFGEDADTYRYDVGFFIGVDAAEIEPHVPVNPDVDVVTWGKRAFYHRRVTALATRSRVSRVVGTPAYASLTLRNWRTTTRLAALLDET